MKARRCKISFLCNALWVGENRKIERGRLQLNLASLSIHGLVKVPVKSHCDDSAVETTTSDLSQLTTVLQRDIEGKSYLCPPVLIHYYALRFCRAIPRYETNSLNRKPVREHRVTIRRGTGRVNLKQQSTGISNH